LGEGNKTTAPKSILGGTYFLSNLVPDGYFFDEHLVFGDLGTGSVLSKGYIVQFPDLSASDDQAFIDLESDIRLMLGSLNNGERLQLQFYTSSDFSTSLNRFMGITRANSKVEICSKVRDELVFRYRDRMACETLIQTNVQLYLSSQLPKFVSDQGRKIRGFDEVFKVERRSFEQRQQFFNLLLREYGGSVRALDNTGPTRSCLSSARQARLVPGIPACKISIGSGLLRIFASSPSWLRGASLSTVSIWMAITSS
jgi:hypothetical protein